MAIIFLINLCPKTRLYQTRNGKDVEISFTSDYSVQGSGFKINWEVIEPEVVDPVDPIVTVGPEEPEEPGPGGALEEPGEQGGAKLLRWRPRGARMRYI